MDQQSLVYKIDTLYYKLHLACISTTSRSIFTNYETLYYIREMVSFIDDIIMRTKEKERYNKAVKKVVKRLIENNLYIKLEKYKWKVREVEFLKVVFESERIKIEIIMMKRVLNWPISKKVKNIIIIDTL